MARVRGKPAFLLSLVQDIFRQNGRLTDGTSSICRFNICEHTTKAYYFYV